MQYETKRNEKIENVWEQLSYEKDFKLKVHHSLYSCYSIIPRPVPVVCADPQNDVIVDPFIGNN